jgi:hypothetical protein
MSEIEMLEHEEMRIECFLNVVTPSKACLRSCRMFENKFVRKKLCSIQIVHSCRMFDLKLSEGYVRLG